MRPGYRRYQQGPVPGNTRTRDPAHFAFEQNPATPRRSMGLHTSNRFSKSLLRLEEIPRGTRVQLFTRWRTSAFRHRSRRWSFGASWTWLPALECRRQAQTCGWVFPGLRVDASIRPTSPSRKTFHNYDNRKQRLHDPRRYPLKIFDDKRFIRICSWNISASEWRQEQDDQSVRRRGSSYDS